MGAGGSCHGQAQYSPARHRAQRKNSLTVIAIRDNRLSAELRQPATFTAVGEEGSSPAPRTVPVSRLGRSAHLERELVFIPVPPHAPQFETALAIPANRRISAVSRALAEMIQARGWYPVTVW